MTKVSIIHSVGTIKVCKKKESCEYIGKRPQKLLKIKDSMGYF